MSTKTMKILVAVATMLTLVAMVSSVVFAIPAPIDITPVDPSSNDIQDFGGRILGILQTVGVVLAVVIVAILGIKYMMGSAEEKAEYKKTMIPYLIGAALVFMAPTIANVVYGFFQSK